MRFFIFNNSILQPLHHRKPTTQKYECKIRNILTHELCQDVYDSEMLKNDGRVGCLVSRQVFCEAKRTSPSILYVPHVQQWWETAGPALRASFLSLLTSIPSFSPILLLATCSVPLQQLDPEVSSWIEPELQHVLHFVTYVVFSVHPGFTLMVERLKYCETEKIERLIQKTLQLRKSGNNVECI